jgi:DNA-binding NarL/FixJ family response regulator
MGIRILIADDQRLFRHSLRMLLEHEDDIKVVGEASDGQEAYEQARSSRVDLVLMDVEMPKLDGIAATRAIAKAQPEIKILMLSAYADDERVMHGIQAGAVGYIVKDASPEEFVRIIRATAAGQDVVSPYLANLNPVVLARMRKGAGDEPHGVAVEVSNLNLSPRQQEIVNLLVLGKSNKEMADKLSLSNDTVKAHLQHIFRKIGVSSRLEAVVFFLTGHRAA